VDFLASPISGRGAYALKPIAAGETVVIWGGTVYTREDILNGKAEPESIAVLSENCYLADPIGSPSPEDYALNHSCDPNVWMGDAITLVARRSIESGEELTADYALWLFDQNWSLNPCRCGSPLCRGVVTDKDWQRRDLQVQYAGHFTPYLNSQIERRRLSRKDPAE
jgi:hypothetical protein